MKISITNSIILSIIIFIQSSCKKFVEVPPPQNQLVTANVFTNDQTATSSMIGLYSQMMTDFSGFAFANGGITLYTGLTGDEFTNYSNSPDETQFYENSLQSTNTNLPQLWGNAFNYIYTCNSVLEGLNHASNLSATIRNQLMGEAYFLRAFIYFNLTNLFGELPLVTSTAYQTNQSLGKSSRSLAYKQIISDLQKAIPLLAIDYSFSGGDRVRSNRWAAVALLSRVYLFTGDWQGAEVEADSVINNNNLFALTDLNSVFLANSQESILQLMPVVSGFNTWEGYNFILTDIPSSSPAQVALSPNLLSDFEPNDLRRTDWVDSVVASGSVYYYPFKYKVQLGQQITEYYTVLRLAEQFLIRAEAKAELNDLSGSLADLNIIRQRAGLPNYSSLLEQDSVLAAIQHENRIEFFAEWGHRWMDLKRTGTISSILSTNKTNWQAKDSLYPIPIGDIQNDINLVQNTGY